VEITHIALAVARGDRKERTTGRKRRSSHAQERFNTATIVALANCSTLLGVRVLRALIGKGSNEMTAALQRPLFARTFVLTD
jgi:hypothetical protein